jgi:hypothetical protein
MQISMGVALVDKRLHICELQKPAVKHDGAMLHAVVHKSACTAGDHGLSLTAWQAVAAGVKLLVEEMMGEKASWSAANAGAPMHVSVVQMTAAAGLALCVSAGSAGAGALPSPAHPPDSDSHHERSTTVVSFGVCVYCCSFFSCLCIACVNSECSSFCMRTVC